MFALGSLCPGRGAGALASFVLLCSIIRKRGAGTIPTSPGGVPSWAVTVILGDEGTSAARAGSLSLCLFPWMVNRPRGRVLPVVRISLQRDK